MEPRQILLLVGLALYYWFRSTAKKNKQKNQQKAKPKTAPPRSTAQDNTPKERSLEEILRELAGESTPKPEPKAKPDNRERQKIKHVEVKQPAYAPEAISTETLPRYRRVAVKPLPEEEHEEVDFDLRQAVINDAIMNRPQY